MIRFQLGGYVCDQDEHRLQLRPVWTAYVIGCCVALGMLAIVGSIIASICADPSLTIETGGSRHHRGQQQIIPWPRQTTQQRVTRVLFPGVPLLILTLVLLLYMWAGLHEQRNPLIFDKPANQLRKGTTVLAKLSTAKCIAVVPVVYVPTGPIFWKRNRTARSLQTTQIFLRFSAEPWSVLINSYRREKTVDRIAKLLADFLAIPVIDDPIVLSRGLPQGKQRGFEVMPKRPNEA